ncbi:MAG: hypothetical protein Q8S11_08120 [Daejeonella sp.]|uniref:hypothetical protein n=1 Tax=Daejeonella sp. TaxID=2805397 RepID=UPI0027340E60|nr:hypothetical protein [Daejeonella sp.]MDP3468285.1 hypothetical protein [Daejeonella sp.]
MKTLIQFGAMALIIFCGAACHSSKLMNRQQARLALKEQSNSKSRVLEHNQFERFEYLIDSSGHSYQLSIFPTDTFKFSLQEGFIGKASKVLIKGSGNQVIRITDTSKTSGTVSSELEEKVRNEVLAKSTERSVSVERKGGLWIGIAAGLIVGLVVVGVWWRVGRG